MAESVTLPHQQNVTILTYASKFLHHTLIRLPVSLALTFFVFFPLIKIKNLCE